MNDIIKFLNIHYDNAIELVKSFEITKAMEWNPQIYLNELYVQLGHVYNVLYPSDSSNEIARKIDNLGDELSDIVLQLINLSYVLNVDMYEVKKLSEYKSNNKLSDFSVLLGQLTEVIMENYNCRFRKDRFGFSSSYEFEKDRILKLFIITFEIADEKKLDMIKEFQLMVEDATDFLEKYKRGHRQMKEYIDIYDANEKLLGYAEKSIAHEKGYWHRVFGCLIYNSKTRKIYFQLKNPKHNGINKNELLEITAGGHLISGETLENGTREILEETGLGVDYEKLVFLLKRKINKKVKKDYIIKEFQYFYSVNLNIKLNDFNNYDENEVLGFYELNINDVIDLLMNRKENIKGKKIINNQVSKVNVIKNDFDEAFIEDGLYLELLNKIIMNNSSSKLNHMYNKLYKTVSREKMLNPKEFYFDDSRVCDIKDYKKDNIKYSIILLNTDKKTSNYLVFLLAIKNGTSVTHLLMKEFKSKRGTSKYFNELSSFVENNTNYQIISGCYNHKFNNNVLNKI